MQPWFKTCFAPYLYKILNSLLPDTSGIPVLTYHGVGLEEDLLCLSINNFKLQMDYLVEQGYYFATLDEVVKYVKEEITLPKKSIAITFDDGFQNNYKYAFPILKKRGIKATLFINTSFIGRKVSAKEAFWQKDYPKKRNILWCFLSWDEIRKMNNNGIAIEPHTHTHVNLTSNNESEIEKEIVLSKDIIERKLNKNVKHFSYPYGAHNKTGSDILKKLGFEAAWILCTYNVKPKMDLYTLPRIGSSDMSIERFKITIGKYGKWISYSKKLFRRK